MRKKLVAGNWKMNNDRDGALALITDIVKRYRGFENEINAGVVLCPPFLYLQTCVELLKDLPGLKTGAQNCHSEAKGAFTGEVSAPMLAALGVSHVIIGHSERRMYFGEDAAFLKAKVIAALAAGLTPIFCCGEVREERESGRHFDVVEHQLTASLFGLSSADFQRIIIAYEPVWAIGTGLTATRQQAQEMHQFIRSLVNVKYSKLAEETIVLYGGSCNAANAAELFSQPDVDGGLIGGASLKADDFMEIIKAASQQSV